jgi:hypothetical protein
MGTLGVLTLMGEILDRALSPEGGADSEAGRAVLKERVGGGTLPYPERVREQATRKGS